jgi:hypothetical protein
MAIRQVDDFVRAQMADYAAKSQPLLQEMDAIANKASKPGVSIGDQLSANDRDLYNRMRHANIQLGGERGLMSDRCGHFIGLEGDRTHANRTRRHFSEKIAKSKSWLGR